MHPARYQGRETVIPQIIKRRLEKIKQPTFTFNDFKKVVNNHRVMGDYSDGTIHRWIKRACRLQFIKKVGKQGQLNVYRHNYGF